MKVKEKLILTITVFLIAVAGIIHAPVRFFKLKENIGNGLPPTVAFLWLIPYSLAIIVCLAAGGIVIHKRKNRELDTAAKK